MESIDLYEAYLYSFIYLFIFWMEREQIFEKYFQTT